MLMPDLICHYARMRDAMQRLYARVMQILSDDDMRERR